jgi:hypothetical protein
MMQVRANPFRLSIQTIANASQTEPNWTEVKPASDNANDSQYLLQLWALANKLMTSLQRLEQAVVKCQPDNFSVESLVGIRDHNSRYIWTTMVVQLLATITPMLQSSPDHWRETSKPQY